MTQHAQASASQHLPGKCNGKRPTRIHRVRSLADTWRLAARLAEAHPDGGVLALHGDLGSGKTTLVQGLARALGIAGPVTSPTFALVNCYDSPTLRLVHMDLFRLSAPDELWTLDFADYLEMPRTLIAIEWPERSGDYLPPWTRHVSIMPGTRPSSRKILIDPPLP